MLVARPPEMTWFGNGTIQPPIIEVSRAGERELNCVHTRTPSSAARNIRCEHFDSTPTMKPGISGISGRVKVGKHPTTVAKLNVEANMVKIGVKLQ
jgi:hypothetical protein